MRKSREIDMLHGAELPAIIRFALPMLIGNLFQQVYNLVDSVVVGRWLGKDALAAVGATGSITYFFYTICLGLGTAAGVMTAQSFGEGNEARVKKVITNSAYVIAAFAIVISLLSTALAGNLLTLLNTPARVLADATGYMRIACMGTLAVAAYNWIAFLLRALGDSKTPLIFLIIASLINAALDVLFVVGFGMGVRGAAVATIASQGLSALGSICYALKTNPHFKLKKEDWRPDMNMCGKCIRTGLPIAAQNAFISLSMIALQRVANGFEETIMAAYTATMRIEQLVQQPFNSLNAAMATFTGQNVGAGQIPRVRKGYRKTMLLGLIFSLVILVLFMPGAELIVSIFVKDPEVIAAGAKGIRLSCCFYFFLGMIHITRGVLNGAGDVNYALFNGICEVAGRIGFSLLLAYVIQVGPISVWATSGLTWLLTGLYCFFRYLQGKWVNKKIQ